MTEPGHTRRVLPLRPVFEIHADIYREGSWVQGVAPQFFSGRSGLDALRRCFGLESFETLKVSNEQIDVSWRFGMDEPKLRRVFATLSNDPSYDYCEMEFTTDGKKPYYSYRLKTSFNDKADTKSFAHVSCAALDRVEVRDILIGDYVFCYTNEEGEASGEKVVGISSRPDDTVQISIDKGLRFWPPFVTVSIIREEEDEDDDE